LATKASSTAKSASASKSTATSKATATKAAPKTAAKSAAKPAPAKAKEAEKPQEVAKPVKEVAKPAKEPTRAKGTLLTEAEVIKQAKTDYMTPDQLEYFKQKLLELQAELRMNAGITTEHLRELSVAPDPADRATQEEEHALELRTRDRERKLLKKVEQALARIEDGSYGWCEETGEPIGIPRLMARPTATLTIEAQERRELKQKMYGE
jgi:DnaK suppressor protein